MPHKQAQVRDYHRWGSVVACGAVDKDLELLDAGHFVKLNGRIDQLLLKCFLEAVVDRHVDDGIHVAVLVVSDQLVGVDLSRKDVVVRLEVEHTRDTFLRQIYDLLEVAWVVADEEIRITELLEKELADKIGIAFINLAINDVDVRSVGLLAQLASSELPAVDTWPMELQKPHWLPFRLLLVVPLDFSVSVSELGVDVIFKLAGLAVLDIWQVNLTLPGSHVDSVFREEPLVLATRPLHLLGLNGAILLVLEIHEHLVVSLVRKHGEPQKILLPNVVHVNDIIVVRFGQIQIGNLVDALLELHERAALVLHNHVLVPKMPLGRLQGNS